VIYSFVGLPKRGIGASSLEPENMPEPLEEGRKEKEKDGRSQASEIVRSATGYKGAVVRGTLEEKRRRQKAEGRFFAHRATSARRLRGREKTAKKCRPKNVTSEKKKNLEGASQGGGNN